MSQPTATGANKGLVVGRLHWSLTLLIRRRRRGRRARDWLLTNSHSRKPSPLLRTGPLRLLCVDLLRTSKLNDKISLFVCSFLFLCFFPQKTKKKTKPSCHCFGESLCSVSSIWLQTVDGQTCLTSWTHQQLFFFLPC